jgi:hypothetical protein
VVLAAAAAARAETKPEGAAEVKALADRIDRRIEAGWKAHQVKPAEPADDATFLRRVYLDLVGQVPSLTEVRDFLDDPAADKRALLVERLLASDAHVRFFATTWRKIMVPQEAQLARGPLLELWLQQQFRDNVGYDKVAREVLAGSANAVPFQEFSLANEDKPENLGAAASRVFLGVRMECAQCHDHPFAKWKKQQFWEFAAFFNRGPLAIPNTNKKVGARLLVGDTPELKPEADPRAVLADWVTRADNPFFAQAAVNRLWLHFFGVGLVDPVDGLGETEAAPSHPELLDELAKEFAAHRFDMRFLIRAITGSKTYMLSSTISDASQNGPRRFARAAVRGLSAEQLYDTLAVVSGKVRPLTRGSGQTVPTDTFGQRADFIARFATPGTPLEAEASILQALHLMNGKPMADLISLESNKLLWTVAEAESLSTARRVEELYLLTLARKPRAEETARLVKYVDAGGARRDKKKAIADVYWALLNSSEFALNH